MPAPDDPSSTFEPLRSALTRLAYRMSGSVADAEDAVQDAFLRWLRADRAAVQQPAAFLRRTVVRLCLDQLKSAKHQRETYIGPWLPDPLIDDDPTTDEDVTLPLMLALERLSPLERAAFLLHDVLGHDFAEVAATLDRDAAACRQLAARARQHVRHPNPPRFPLDRQRGLALAQAFFTASRTGESQPLAAMLAADATLCADGGGKRPAARKPVIGIDALLKLHAGLLKLPPPTLLRTTFINGLPGFLTLEHDALPQSTALATNPQGQVTTLYVVRNPEKLRHLVLG